MSYNDNDHAEPDSKVDDTEVLFPLHFERNAKGAPCIVAHYGHAPVPVGLGWTTKSRGSKHSAKLDAYPFNPSWVQTGFQTTGDEYWLTLLRDAKRAIKEWATEGASATPNENLSPTSRGILPD